MVCLFNYQEILNFYIILFKCMPTLKICKNIQLNNQNVITHYDLQSLDIFNQNYNNKSRAK